MNSLGDGDNNSFSSDSNAKSTPIPMNITADKLHDGRNNKKSGKILHFCDGTLEECDPVEDEKDCKSQPDVDPSSLSWGPWIFNQVANAGSKTLKVVDYVGESLANFFGITTPKYQYEIDEYEIMCAEEEEDKKNEDLEMGGWVEGSSQTVGNESRPSHSTEVVYDGPIKLQPNTVQS